MLSFDSDMLSLEEIEALDIIMGGRTTINYGQSGSEMEKEIPLMSS